MFWLVLRKIVKGLMMFKLYALIKSVLYWTTLICPVIDAVKGIAHGASAARKEELWKRNNADKMAFFESFLDVQEEEEEEK